MTQSDFSQKHLSHLVFALMCLNGTTIAASYSFVPVLGPLFKALNLQPWHAGLGVALTGLAWALSAPFWGRVVDRKGQKWVLLMALPAFTLCIAGTVLYVHFALYHVDLVWLNLTMLMISRILIGAIFAAIPVASLGWLAQSTTPVQRTALMARLAGAGAIGMILAPPIAGALMVKSLILPLYLSVLLPILAWPLLKRLADPERSAKAQVDDLAEIKLSLSDTRLRSPLAIIFILFGAVLVLDINLSFWLMDQYHMALAEAGHTTGLALCCEGVALICVQTVIAKRKDTSPRIYLQCGALLGILGFVVLLAAFYWQWPTPWMLPVTFWVYIGCTFIGAGLGMAFPAANAFCANAVSFKEQNAAAALMTMAQGMSMVISPLVGGVLYTLNPVTPFMTAIAGLGLIYLLTVRKKGTS